MKTISEEQYDAFVQRLAGEILSDTAMEVEADEFNEGMEVEAGVVNNFKSGVKDIAKGVKGLGAARQYAKDGFPAIGRAAGKGSREAIAAGAKKVAPAAGVAVGAAGAGTAATISAMKKKKQEKEAAMNQEGFEKSAEEAYIESVVEKAASVFEEAQQMKAAALEVLKEAEAYEEASMEVMAELGLLDDEMEVEAEEVVEE